MPIIKCFARDYGSLILSSKLITTKWWTNHSATNSSKTWILEGDLENCTACYMRSCLSCSCLNFVFWIFYFEFWISYFVYFVFAPYCASLTKRAILDNSVAGLILNAGFKSEERLSHDRSQQVWSPLFLSFHWSRASQSLTKTLGTRVLLFCSGVYLQTLVLTASASTQIAFPPVYPWGKKRPKDGSLQEKSRTRSTNQEQRKHRAHDPCFSLNIDINAILRILHEHMSQRHQLIFFQASRNALQMRPCNEFSLVSNGSKRSL